MFALVHVNIQLFVIMIRVNATALLEVMLYKKCHCDIRATGIMTKQTVKLCLVNSEHIHAKANP